LVIFILAYRPHRLLEEVGEYDGAAIKDALYELGVGYSGASGTTTWDENGDRFSATYGIGNYNMTIEQENTST
jgi:ABC-type branched-subunit amino acid transport system substrate-binding protein